MTAPPPSIKPRLLIVDDEITHVQALCATLTDHDYEVVGLTSGKEALEVLQHENVDLLLIDLIMPEMDGIELLRSALAVNPTLVGIIMTGVGTIATAVRAMQAGAFDYILKPFALSDVLPVLSRALTVRRLRYDNALLLEHLRERSAALERSNARLRAVAEERARFVATMSHELRTPLNAIIGLVDMLLEQDSSPQQQELLGMIQTSGAHLLAVINDVLDFSKIDAGKLGMDRHLFTVSTCIEDALELMVPIAAEKGVELEYCYDESVPAQIIGDSNRVRQILVNYLSNAVKFTERGKVTVQVHSRVLTDSVHEIEFAVRDTGTGIAPNRLDRLFKPFSQIDAAPTHALGGTGLGLAICKRLAELMGGRVWADSEIGTGTTFHFTILAEVTAETGSEGEGELQGLRLLVIEGNATHRRLLRTMTNAWGVLMHGTEIPEDALRLLRQGERFDVILVDHCILAADSTAIAELQAAQVPLILLSPLGSAATADPWFAAVIPKPIRQSTVRDVLLQHARRSPVMSTRIGAMETVPLENLRILVAEDNVINQKVLLLMLESLGCRADVVSNGKEAVEAAARRRYDLILMDLQMPVMDGPAAAEALEQQLPAEQRPRVVALTASAFESDRDQCLAAGMQDFVSKPIHKNRLAEVLQDTATLAAMQPNR